ncbi:hypothetical protein [Acinetobacter sp. WCHAc060025]|uniref:hypothetical protein n=1 Tax=Acinetobacter sp. WCHAc060025 TaxID=2518625 RepID=UPI001023E273|nr:hypothetical protein [Acinetobacter sp. WCHAc060025]RZG76097.1 hypothetical protein EXE09_09245 [Acinetobacter sp. WCHAc060025]
MFVTMQLDVLTTILTDHGCVKSVLENLNRKFVNIEATLLRAKVLREFSKQKHTAIIQSAITNHDGQDDHTKLAYLFAPFILSNLNQTVIYSTPLTEPVLNNLKRYYQVEKTLNLKKIDDNVLESLNLFLDFHDSNGSDAEFVLMQLINALTQADVSTIFLISDCLISSEALFEIEKFFHVRILQIQPTQQALLLNYSFDASQAPLEMQKLLFKRKDDFHIDLCRRYAELNAQILYLSGLYDFERAKNLVDDMFYSEHIYEKLSVYAEYMQTQLQNKVFDRHAQQLFA